MYTCVYMCMCIYIYIYPLVIRPEGSWGAPGLENAPS